MDELENWKISDYSNVATRLKSKYIVEAITEHVERKYAGKLSLCKKRKGNLQGEITFLLEGKDDLSVLDISELISFITELLAYPKIFIQLKNIYEDKILSKLYSKVIPYLTNNLDEVSELLCSDNPSPLSLSQTDFFASDVKTSKISPQSLELAYKFMQLAVEDDPANLEKIIQKAKELGSPKDGLDK